MNEMYEASGFADKSKKIGLNVIGFAVFVVIAAAISLAVWNTTLPGQMRTFLTGAGMIVAAVLALSPRVADQREKAVVLRLGKFRELKGPGLLWLIPFVDRVVMWIDARVRTTRFAAEKTLTSDTVPVNVDAVLFWTVTDCEERSDVAIFCYGNGCTTEIATLPLVARDDTLTDCSQTSWGL